MGLNCHKNHAISGQTIPDMVPISFLKRVILTCLLVEGDVSARRYCSTQSTQKQVITGPDCNELDATQKTERRHLSRRRASVKLEIPGFVFVMPGAFTPGNAQKPRRSIGKNECTSIRTRRRLIPLLPKHRRQTPNGMRRTKSPDVPVGV